MYSAPTTPLQFPIYANIRCNKKNSDSDLQIAFMKVSCVRKICFNLNSHNVLVNVFSDLSPKSESRRPLVY